MEGPAIARWVKRHTNEERFLAMCALADAAMEQVRSALEARLGRPPTLRELREEIRRLRNG